HEHSDHVQGLTTLCAKLQIPIFCNHLTQEAVETQLQARFDCRIFTTGATFEVGDVVVDTFSVPHDAYDPVGFLVRTSAGNIGFLTDLGHATNLVIERVRIANVLLLETNHDLKLLQADTKRPWSIKQRILSRHGHLSNDAAAGLVERIVSAELRHLYLGHLSRDCNQPERAIDAVRARLQKMSVDHVRIEAASQDVPCSTLSL